MKKTLLIHVGCILAASGAASASAPDRSLTLQGPIRVGTKSYTYRASPAVSASTSLVSTLAWREEIHVFGASYIAPHFSKFTLPEGAWAVVRSPDGKRSWTYTRFGKGKKRLKDGFWGIHIPGDTAIIELYSMVPLAEGAVVIDRYAQGYPGNPLSELGGQIESICGVDDSLWAKCYQSSEREAYDKGRAVARLLTGGDRYCTGWLVGDGGHLMTNNHCIRTMWDAQNTDYEFLAEGATCSTDCRTAGGCPGVVVATSATLIQIDNQLDYALVQLPTNPTGTYGFLQLRDSGAVLGERIYIPQHPRGWGKRIAIASSDSRNPTGFCEVDSLSQPACTGSVPAIGYYCDTQGSSSGSPVVGYVDNCVVALHQCPQWQNRGIPIQAVISDLGANLPPNALCSPPGRWKPGRFDDFEVCDGVPRCPAGVSVGAACFGIGTECVEHLDVQDETCETLICEA